MSLQIANFNIVNKKSWLLILSYWDDKKYYFLDPVLAVLTMSWLHSEATRARSHLVYLG